MTRTDEALRGAVARNSLEILFRRAGERGWETLARPRALKTQVDEGRPTYRLEADAAGLGAGRAQQTFAAEVVVMQHYTASTDLRYLPRAIVSHWVDRGAGVQVRLSAQPDELPVLPEGLAGWEGRFGSYLVYTANARTLPLVLHALRNARRREDEPAGPNATGEALVTDSSVELPSLELEFGAPEPARPAPASGRRGRTELPEMTAADLIAFLRQAQDPSDPLNLSLAPDDDSPGRADEPAPKPGRPAGRPRPRKVAPRRPRPEPDG